LTDQVLFLLFLSSDTLSRFNLKDRLRSPR